VIAIGRGDDEITFAAPRVPACRSMHTISPAHSRSRAYVRDEAGVHTPLPKTCERQDRHSITPPPGLSLPRVRAREACGNPVSASSRFALLRRSTRTRASVRARWRACFARPSHHSPTNSPKPSPPGPNTSPHSPNGQPRACSPTGQRRSPRPDAAQGTARSRTDGTYRTSRTTQPWGSACPLGREWTRLGSNTRPIRPFALSPVR
jgi:hypothetical protein